MTGVLIHVADWSHALSVWLDARHALVREWGVAKHAELHAVDLVKGRGRYCETREQEDAFLAARQAAYGLLLGRVHRTRAQVLTVGAKASGPTVYGLLVDQLESSLIALLGSMWPWWLPTESCPRGTLGPLGPRVSAFCSTMMENAVSDGAGPGVLDPAATRLTHPAASRGEP